jgi:hypothetical protein
MVRIPVEVVVGDVVDEPHPVRHTNTAVTAMTRLAKSDMT